MQADSEEFLYRVLNVEIFYKNHCFSHSERTFRKYTDIRPLLECWEIFSNFFDVPLDHLYSALVFTRRLKELDTPGNLVIVSPDAGGMAMARSYSKRLNCPLALVDKRRPRPNVSEVVNVIGDVAGKNVIIRDDMIDTGGSLAGAAEALKKNGANIIFAACTHALLSGPSVQRIEASSLTTLIVSDSIGLTPEKRIEKIEVLSVASLFGEAIRRIHEEKSVSSLFESADQT